VLRDLREVIMKGEFTRTSDENNCRFCEYVAACGGEVNRQAEEKREDPKLEAYRRLTEHD
jgi:radical SAM protein with 4Fe4S-binding SPASM domain